MWSGRALRADLCALEKTGAGPLELSSSAGQLALELFEQGRSVRWVQLELRTQRGQAWDPHGQTAALEFVRRAAQGVSLRARQESGFASLFRCAGLALEFSPCWRSAMD